MVSGRISSKPGGYGQEGFDSASAGQSFRGYQHVILKMLDSIKVE
jgi:hypothetical protein